MKRGRWQWMQGWCYNDLDHPKGEINELQLAESISIVVNSSQIKNSGLTTELEKKSNRN